MPIYEWNCEPCGFRFEALAAISEGNLPRPCPECGELAERVISACVIGAGALASGSRGETSSQAPAPHGHNHSGHSPIPAPARLCWMDDKSAQRFAAYKSGRGHEFDDRRAAIAEQRKRRGEPPEPAPALVASPVARALERKKAKEAAAKPAANPASGLGSAITSG
jgi:putative FmdB family regulatory protein